jgi:hypothetical protein
MDAKLAPVRGENPHGLRPNYAYIVHFSVINYFNGIMDWNPLDRHHYEAQLRLYGFKQRVFRKRSWHEVYGRVGLWMLS